VTPLRAVIATPWGERAGGAEQMLWTILRHLDRTKIEPELVFLSPGPFAGEVSSLGIPTRTVSAGRLRQPINYVRALAALARLIRERNPDIVIAWSAKAHIYLGMANLLTRSRRPAIWWQHGIPSGHWLDRLATLIPATAVGCSSHPCEEAQLRLRPQRRTFVVHPGVEARGPRSGTSRSKLGIPDDAWVVGSVGRLQPWKGHDRVIAAVADLRQRDIGAFALIIGGESFGLSQGYAKDLQALARTEGVQDHVLFTGHVPNPTDYHRLMDVFVNASDNEPFGIALVEAMAAGLPVVASRRGGPAEIIEDCVSGLLFEPCGLSDALAILAHDDVFARGLAAAGAERARSLFAAPRAAGEFERRVISAACVARRLTRER
jgi:glycosyltransferase involved in cell wall biosynthesis